MGQKTAFFFDIFCDLNCDGEQQDLVVAAHARYMIFRVMSLLRRLTSQPATAITGWSINGALLHVYLTRPITINERIASSRDLSTSLIVGILEGDVLLVLVERLVRRQYHVHVAPHAR